ncbi:PH domain-containing protein [Nocardioides sp. REDSEA-S30_B4]|uniref:PH domain-containing protein n=1 Tax=Nocardioides sp. REDSEA-S30_B4 TaxID=1811552 RepID=UPI000ADC6C94|nr:PH domain-containing protein [Nocardioides sp. REDSEA-S30_B4]
MSDWQRLDPRMLVVEPVSELRRFLPVLLGALLAGGFARGGGLGWELLAVAVPVAIGVARYLTTRYRILDGRVELRRGLLQRTLRTAQLDRVRTVDVTASLVHRVLGLATVRIGTGAGAEQDLELDGLRAPQAQELREALLARVAHEAHAPDGAEAAAPRAAPTERPVLRLDPGWARYAPFTSAGVVAAAALLGVASQALPDSAWRLDRLPDLAPAGWGWLLLVAVGVLGAAVSSAVLAVLGYLVAHWDLTLTRTPTQWRLTRGLLTTRETSVEDARLAGVVVREPLGLRLAGAAELGAVVTGLGQGEKGTLTLVPPAPRAVVDGVAGAVLGDDRPTDAPLTAPLRTHGPAAVRRRRLRALAPAVVLVALAAASVVADLLTPWSLALTLLVLPAAIALGEDRARSLGHLASEGFLVSRSGSLARHREVLGAEHVIGWTVRDTWFQRRSGLVTLEATTAGGSQRVQVLDVPEHDGLVLAAALTPDLLAEVGYRTPPSQ